MQFDGVPTGKGPLHVGDILGRQAEVRGDAPALLGLDGDPLSYAGLHEEVARVERSLNEMGIGRADAVAVVLPNGPEMAVAFLGVSSVAVCAPLNPAYRGEEFRFYLTDLGARAVLVREGEASPVRGAAAELGISVIDVRPLEGGPVGVFDLSGPSVGAPANASPVRPEDVALVLHTSGTTARPKIVPLRHVNICSSAHNIRTTLALTPSDRCLNVMPLFHIHGLMAALLSSIAAGGSVVCTPGFDAPRFFDWIERSEPTWYTAVPTMHQAILARAEAHAERAERADLRFVRSSSASLAPRVMAQLEETFGAPVIEAYGMTEAAHQMASNPLPPRPRKPGSVGVAAGPEVAIMDEDGGLLAPGRTGEIVVRGANIMSGYANNPDANATAFTDGWFRTGDEGRLDADGYLFITGRLKEIINRGGEKVSPREVDEVLLGHPAVAQAAAFAMPDPRLGEEVAAAVVLRPGADANEGDLRDFAAERLAPFKVPRKVVLLHEIPKGPSGKIQRIGLAERLGLAEPEAAPGRQAFAPPRNETERKLTALWSEVLGAEQVGVRDDFFAVGGDSMLATKLAASIADEFGVELPLVHFFDEASTVEKQAAMVAARGAGDGMAVPALRHLARSGPQPLSHGQKRIWLLQQLTGDAGVYNRPWALRLRGAPDVGILERALSEMVRRHEVLRTRFPAVDGEPVQVVDDAPQVRLPAVRLEGEATFREFARREGAKQFDLRAEHPIRFTLCRTGDGEHFLLVVGHHIAFDGLSQEPFLDELASLYQAFAQGTALPEEPPVQYADFAAWERERFTEEAINRHLDYWKRKLGHEPPELDMPTDRPRPAIPSWRGARVPVELSRQLTDELAALGRANGATLFMTLMAAFQLLLHRYTDQYRIAVGTPTSGRAHHRLQKLIGSFVNTVLLCSELAENPQFSDYLRQARDTCLEAYAHQDLPFELLVAELQPERSADRNPMFQAMFVLKPAPPEARRCCELEIGPMDVDPGKAMLDLDLELFDTKGGITGTLTYSTDLFDAGTMKRLVRSFETLLRSILREPESPVGALPLLHEDERRRVLVDPNATEVDLPAEPTFLEVFERRTRASPDSPAVQVGDTTLSYAELNRRANRLAHYLREIGVRPNDLVAVGTADPHSFPEAILGVLKSGAAYVPLDPSYPRERLRFMLSDAGAEVLIAGPDSPTDLTMAGLRTVHLQHDRDAIGRASEADPAPMAGPNDLAYCIYTSGSTGRPNGVLVRHRSLLNLAKAEADAYKLGPQHRTLQFASLSFDVSVEEIFPAWYAGGVVVIPERRITAPDAAFMRLLEEQRVSVLHLPPVFWSEWIRTVQETGRAVPKTLEVLEVGGEEPSAAAYSEWQALAGDRIRWFNGYGPTEATVTATIYEAKPRSAPLHRIPIGRPIANTRCYVLDRWLMPVPTGARGELFIGGVGVADGYHNRPELTAERFLPDPFSDCSDARMYRTGDLARFLPDGNLEYLGRRDQQVKVRGFRIELTGVESVLNAHPQVTAAVVVAPREGASRRLAAYVVAGAAAPSVEDLRRFLSDRLPPYMVPSNIALVDKLPTTPAGKVDRISLEKLPPVAEHRRDSEPPINGLEACLLRLWRKALGNDSIGVTDGFFEVGGHSLLAARLFANVEKLSGREIPLIYLYQYPTVRGFAEAMRNRGWQPRSPLVPLQADGARPPLFFVTPFNVWELHRLAHRLGDDQPFYGLQPLGLRERGEMPSSIEALADAYMRELRRTCPSGPYRLGGLSAGGVVAFEMAQRLRHDGERVEVLFLLDSYVGTGSKPFRIRRLQRRLGAQWRDLSRLGLRGKGAYILSGLGRTARRITAPLRGGADPGARNRRGELRGLAERVVAAHGRAVLAYRARPYDGRIVLFTSDPEAMTLARDPSDSWRELARGPFEVHPISAVHEEMLREPAVEQLADLMRDLADEAPRA